jgi:hypothetical protein
MDLPLRALCRVVRHPDRDDLWAPKLSPAFHAISASRAVYGPGTPPRWAIVAASAASAAALAAIASDPDIFLIPDLSHDRPLTALGLATRSLLWSRLQEITGVSRDQLGLSDGSSLRDLLSRLARLDSPAFDLDRFSAGIAAPTG